VSFERPTAGTGLGAEPSPSARIDPAVATRLQILSTEHWSLLASRSLAWNESFSRAGMFLSTLSGAVVALALVAQASAFGDGFTLFALVILPVVLLIGVATHLRLGASNYHEAMCVIGMNRIRAAYLEIAPDLAPYFVMGTHDDPPGMAKTMAVLPGGGRIFWLGQVLSGTPTVVMILNAVVAGAIGAIATLRLGGAPLVVLLVGALAFVGTIVLELWRANRVIARIGARMRPLFPTPETEV
jgi:hypothetical protein